MSKLSAYFIVTNCFSLFLSFMCLIIKIVKIPKKHTHIHTQTQKKSWFLSDHFHFSPKNPIALLFVFSFYMYIILLLSPLYSHMIQPW
ncbi:hypothetical protein J3Q64DRAFT_1490781 [Phycomyces blakesleeanus]|uniref:Uncharacterized protein n=1 Tax=Phycomyces blakesleeanus TaxID=4837 RepID=A0ABR3AZI7_PHYBL